MSEYVKRFIMYVEKINGLVPVLSDVITLVVCNIEQCKWHTIIWVCWHLKEESN